MISKFKKDSGDAIAVLGMMLIVVILVIGGGVFDFTKGYQLKKGYNNAAQHATHSAIMHQHSNTGTLKISHAAAQAIISYENLANSGVVRKTNALARCDNGMNREIKILFAKNRQAAKAYKAGSNVYPKGVDEALVWNLDEHSVSPNDHNFTNDVSRLATRLNAEIPQRIRFGQYDTIILEIYETTPNTMLSTGLIASGNVDEGKEMKCQRIGVKSIASTYLENE